MRENVDFERDEAVDVLSGKIVDLVRDDMDRNGVDGVAERSMLLAQHRLFGALYMRELFTGNVLC